MNRDFFDPTPELQNVGLVDFAILRITEQMIESRFFVISLLMTEPIRRY
jgi:hypothetical protein